MKILIVEDDYLNLKLYSEIMELSGFEVVQAKDGLNVIELARMHSPSAIIMDLQLPFKNGLQLTIELKAHAELANIPIIAVTGFAEPQHRTFCIESGFDDFFSKPLNIRELVASVARLTNIKMPNFMIEHGHSVSL